MSEIVLEQYISNYCHRNIKQHNAHVTRSQSIAKSLRSLICLRFSWILFIIAWFGS